MGNVQLTLRQRPRGERHSPTTGTAEVPGAIGILGCHLIRADLEQL
jgi:hypothetical protein